MSTTYDDAPHARVPALWEIFRTLSGLVVVGGVAFALAAGVRITDRRGDTAVEAMRPPAAGVVLQSARRPQEVRVHYLVSSEEQADQVRYWSFFENVHLGGDAWQWPTSYIVSVITSEEDAITVGSAMAGSPDVTGGVLRLVDLRRR